MVHTEEAIIINPRRTPWAFIEIFQLRLVGNTVGNSERVNILYWYVQPGKSSTLRDICTSACKGPAWRLSRYIGSVQHECLKRFLELHLFVGHDECARREPDWLARVKDASFEDTDEITTILLLAA